MITTRAFSGQRFAVLGLARSGLAAVESLLAGGAQVMAWDAREEPRRMLEAKGRVGRVELADPALADLTGFAGVVVSPGVPLNQHPIAQVAADAGVPIIGDIELFAMARDQLPAHRVVGITGTNGKSTTTALVHHIVQSAALPVRMGGNIGLPILGQTPLAAGGVYVLELSSYQLDLTQTLACDVAALLNISPDHLDRYDDFAGYAASKARLLAMQHADQFAVLGAGDAETAAVAEHEAARRAPGRVQVADGHDLAALSCVGFITTYQRGTEWAATGKVKQKVPPDFPPADKTSTRREYEPPAGWTSPGGRPRPQSPAADRVPIK